MPNVTAQPSATPTNRNIPTQYSQTARTASHHVSIMVGMNCARPERNGNVYEGELRAPDRRDDEHGREDQEEALRGNEPERAGCEQEVPQCVLQARNPRQRQDQQVRQLTPRLGNALNQLEHGPLLQSSGMANEHLSHSNPPAVYVRC